MSSFTRAAVAASVTAVLSCAGLVAVAPAADAATSYKNCTALHKTWKHGVGKRYAKDHTSGTPVTNFYRSTKAYNTAMKRNSGLDRDKDGIACEAR